MIFGDKMCIFKFLNGFAAAIRIQYLRDWKSILQICLYVAIVHINKEVAICLA